MGFFVLESFSSWGLTNFGTMGLSIFEVPCHLRHLRVLPQVGILFLLEEVPLAFSYCYFWPNCLFPPFQSSPLPYNFEVRMIAFCEIHRCMRSLPMALGSLGLGQPFLAGSICLFVCLFYLRSAHRTVAGLRVEALAIPFSISDTGLVRVPGIPCPEFNKR